MSRQRLVLMTICLLLAWQAAGMAALRDGFDARRDRAWIMFENWGGALFNTYEELERSPELKLLIAHPEDIQPGTRAYVPHDWQGTDEDLKLLAVIGDVYSLSLESSRITDNSLRALALLPGIESLRIADCSLSTDGLTLLAPHWHLRELWLEDDFVSVPACATLGRLPELQRLEISAGGVIKERGLRALLASSSLRSLEIDDLRLFSFSASEQRLPPNTSLKQLTLSGYMDVPSLAELCRNCQNLKSLALGSSKLHNGTLVELRAALPGVEVSHSSEHEMEFVDDWHCFGPPPKQTRK